MNITKIPILFIGYLLISISVNGQSSFMNQSSHLSVSIDTLFHVEGVTEQEKFSRQLTELTGNILTSFQNELDFTFYHNYRLSKKKQKNTDITLSLSYLPFNKNRQKGIELIMELKDNISRQTLSKNNTLILNPNHEKDWTEAERITLLQELKPHIELMIKSGLPRFDLSVVPSNFSNQNDNLCMNQRFTTDNEQLQFLAEQFTSLTASILINDLQLSDKFQKKCNIHLNYLTDEKVDCPTQLRGKLSETDKEVSLLLWLQGKVYTRKTVSVSIPKVLLEQEKQRLISIYLHKVAGLYYTF